MLPLCAAWGVGAIPYSPLGLVMTPMSAWYWGRDDLQGPFLEQMPLGRWATEAEIAAPVVFLLSDAASMISGVSLPVDGGYTAR